MGAVRTTYAMAAACIVRRKQCIDLGLGDPFMREFRSSNPMTTLASSPGSQSQAAMVLEQGMEPIKIYFLINLEYSGNAKGTQRISLETSPYPPTKQALFNLLRQPYTYIIPR
jgi:hypothetical protein